MKMRENADGSVTVQAWKLTKSGKGSQLVYDQKTALNWFADGWDMEVVAITRTHNRAPRFEYGVVI